MLNMIELSDLRQYKDEMPDGRMKDLLNKLIFEYSEYAECGTVEDCQNRKEWMSFSMEDVMQNFTKVVKGLQEEVEQIRSDYEKPKRRGRPPKKEEQKQPEATWDYDVYDLRPWHCSRCGYPRTTIQGLDECPECGAKIIGRRG